MSLRRAASALVLLPVSAAVSAATLELGPRGAGAPQATWVARGDAAAAPDHALAPRLTIDGALAVTLPDGATLVQRPLGIVSRPPHRVPLGMPADRKPLPAGQASLSSWGSEDTALLRGTWSGVDETFTLRPGRVEHDVVLSAAALAQLGRGDVVARWRLDLPAGHSLAPGIGGDVLVVDALGRTIARLPAPVVADADDTHASAGVARHEIDGAALSVVVPEAWAFDPARALPLRIDPTISIQPFSEAQAGFVDEMGAVVTSEILSGTLLQIGFGSQVRGFAEFDTSPVPDGATITDVRLRAWLSNHDNPADVAVPLRSEVKHVAARATDPPPALWAAIAPMFTGRVYVADTIPRTGPEWCPDAYVFRDYDLGPLADADVQAQLGSDFLTLGFTSEIVTDPLFDHVDYVGFPELLDGASCADVDMTGKRITLVVAYESNRPPVCDAGGPYAADCPRADVRLDGTGSFDPDGDPVTFAWTSDCPGTIDDADRAVATLRLDGDCVVSCTAALAVSDPSTTVACSTPVTAADTTPPEIVSSDLGALCAWPPRHDMFCAGLASDHVVARDACQPGVSVRWRGCASDQPDEAREDGRPENGDGNFSGDCRVSSDELCVRVERAGHDPVAGRNTFDGRHYGLAVEVDDGCGNVVVVSGSLTVPHDRRGGSGGPDDPCVRGSGAK